MGAADEIDDEDGVEDGEPAGCGRIHAHPVRDPRHEVADEADAHQRGDAHEDGGQVRVEGRDVDDAVAHPQRQRAVGRRRVAPDPRHLIGVVAGQRSGPDEIGVEAVVDQPPVGRVRVGVVREDQRPEQERRGDDQQDGPVAQLRQAEPAPSGGAEPEPRFEQQAEAEQGGDRAHPFGGGAVEADGAQHVPDGRRLRQVGRAERPEQDAERADETQPDVAGGGGKPQFPPSARRSASHCRRAGRDHAAGLQGASSMARARHPRRGPRWGTARCTRRNTCTATSRW